MKLQTLKSIVLLLLIIDQTPVQVQAQVASSTANINTTSLNSTMSTIYTEGKGALAGEAQKTRTLDLQFTQNYVKLGDSIRFAFDLAVKDPINHYSWEAGFILATPLRVISPIVYNVFKFPLNVMTQHGNLCTGNVNWLDIDPMDQTLELISCQQFYIYNKNSVNPNTFDPMSAVEVGEYAVMSNVNQMMSQQKPEDLAIYQEAAMNKLQQENNSSKTNVDSKITGATGLINSKLSSASYTQEHQQYQNDYSTTEKAYADILVQQELSSIVKGFQADLNNKTGNKLESNDQGPLTGAMTAGQIKLNSIDKVEGNSPVLQSIQKLNINPGTINQAQKLEDKQQELVVQKVNDLTSSTTGGSVSSRQDSELDQINQQQLVDKINLQSDKLIQFVNLQAPEDGTIASNNLGHYNDVLLNTTSKVAQKATSFQQSDVLSMVQKVTMGGGGDGPNYEYLNHIQSFHPVDVSIKSQLQAKLGALLQGQNSKEITFNTITLTSGYTYEIKASAYITNGTTQHLATTQPFYFTVVDKVPLKTVQDKEAQSTVTLSSNCINECDIFTVDWSQLAQSLAQRNQTFSSIKISVGPLYALESDNECMNHQALRLFLNLKVTQTSQQIQINDSNVIGTEFYFLRFIYQTDKMNSDSEVVIYKMIAVQQVKGNDKDNTCSSRRVLKQQKQNLASLLEEQKSHSKKAKSFTNEKLSFAGSVSFQQKKELKNQNFVKSPDAGLGYSSPTDFLAATQGDSLISYLSKNPNYMEAISLCKSSDIYTSPFLQYKAFDESTQLIFINARQGAASSNQFGCGPNGDCFAYGTCKSVVNNVKTRHYQCSCIEGRAGKFCQYTSEQMDEIQVIQSALISNVGSIFGIDIDGGVSDDVPMIDDKLNSTKLILGLVQSELTNEQTKQVTALLSALVSGPNKFDSSEQYGLFKGALGGQIQIVAGNTLMTKKQRRNEMIKGELHKVKAKFVSKAAQFMAQNQQQTLDTSVGNEVATLSVISDTNNQIRLNETVTDSSGNIFQAPTVIANQAIPEAAYASLSVSGCVDSTIDCDLSQSVATLDVLDSEGMPLEVSEGADISLSLSIVGESEFKCQYWDVDDEQLSTDGVETVISDDGKFAICKTNHLTTFTAGQNLPVETDLLNNQGYLVSALCLFIISTIII